MQREAGNWRGDTPEQREVACRTPTWCHGGCQIAEGGLMDLVYRRSYPFDGRFTVEFAIHGIRFQARWSPHIPEGRKARSLLPGYRRARDDFLARLDVNALVVEP
jgi:hypothetical protein